MKNLDLRRNRTNSKGITLVALVISIVVLLILATVTVQTLTGNNGLLTKAETAVQSNNDSQELEKIKLAVAAAQLAGQGTITTNNLNTELQTIFNNDKTVTESSNYYIYKLLDKDYIIYKNGNVEINSKMYLYKEGNQCLDITGGWEEWSGDYSYSSELGGNQNVMIARAQGGHSHFGHIYIKTKNKIDLSEYSKYEIELKVSHQTNGTNREHYGYFGFSNELIGRNYYLKIPNKGSFINDNNIYSEYIKIYGNINKEDDVNNYYFFFGGCIDNGNESIYTVKNITLYR